MADYRGYFRSHTVPAFFVRSVFVIEAVQSDADESDDGDNDEQFRKRESPGAPKGRKAAWANDLQNI